jgi:hypothetical protein
MTLRSGQHEATRHRNNIVGVVRVDDMRGYAGFSATAR